MKISIQLGHTKVGIIFPFDPIQPKNTNEYAPKINLILNLYYLLLAQNEGLALSRNCIVTRTHSTVTLKQLLDFLVALVPLDS